VSDFTRPIQTDFVREVLRLNSNQVVARKSGDVDAIEQADHELAMLFLYNDQGRLSEWMAREK